MLKGFEVFEVKGSAGFQGCLCQSVSGQRHKKTTTNPEP